MLVSHRKRFIFTKTVKTAGTSVEVYFEPYCMPEGEWEFAHNRPEHVSPAGIVGRRGGGVGEWYNHMPAREIRDKLDPAVWEGYFKFTVVRNPFEKALSSYHHHERKLAAMSTGAGLRDRLRYLIGRPDAVGPLSGSTPQQRFRSLVRSGRLPCDRDKYLIDGEPCVDYFIRTEHLMEDLQEVCERLDIPFEPEKMRQLKGGLRPKDIPTRDYYDAESEERVRKLYAWEIERFGYEMPAA